MRSAISVGLKASPASRVAIALVRVLLHHPHQRTNACIALVAQAIAFSRVGKILASGSDIPQLGSGMFARVSVVL